MHVFSDLQPYICTFKGCREMLVTFPSRELWSKHEFTEHRIDKTFRCHLCSDHFDNETLFGQHLGHRHSLRLSHTQLHATITAARSSSAKPLNDQPCPLCFQKEWVSQRSFTTHVGQHMEEIALACLPRDIDSESDSESVSQESPPYSPAVMLPIVETGANPPSITGHRLPPINLTDEIGRRKTVIVRNPLKIAFCSFCENHPEGFHGELELRRHMERAHQTTRRVWVCVDISADKTFLANCKACRNQKTYGAYYNAAAHLRRVHFSPNKTSSRSKPSKIRGGKEPPMELLRPWTKEVWEDTDKRSILDLDTSACGSLAPAQVSSYWSAPELRKFPDLVAYFGRDFEAIASFLQTKTPTMVRIRRVL